MEKQDGKTRVSTYKRTSFSSIFSLLPLLASGARDLSALATITVCGVRRGQIYKLGSTTTANNKNNKNNNNNNNNNHNQQQQQPQPQQQHIKKRTTPRTHRSIPILLSWRFDHRPSSRLRCVANARATRSANPLWWWWWCWEGVASREETNQEGKKRNKTIAAQYRASFTSPVLSLTLAAIAAPCNNSPIHSHTQKKRASHARTIQLSCFSSCATATGVTSACHVAFAPVPPAAPCGGERRGGGMSRRLRVRNPPKKKEHTCTSMAGRLPARRFPRHCPAHPVAPQQSPRGRPRARRHDAPGQARSRCRPASPAKKIQPCELVQCVAQKQRSNTRQTSNAHAYEATQ